MLRYFRLSPEVASPVPARETYEKRGPGQGWPEHCPPLRAANAFGWDVPASFDMTFRRRRDGTWEHEDPVDVTSDWTWAAASAPVGAHGGVAPAPAPAPGEGEEDEDVPLVQRNAWFWEKGQTLPHPISDEVYEAVKDQVKVSTFLFLETDPNEVLLVTGVPNLVRPWRAMTALVETDWYPASYPWHCVLELDRRERRIVVPKGEPICRLLPVRRDTYLAREMDDGEFDSFFRRGQAWLEAHGKGEPGPMMDIRGQYARQQARSRFLVLP